MSVLGAVAAGVTGFFTGWNPQAMALAYSVGSGVDGMINAPDRIGPRLEDLKIQMSQYGAMVPFEWGCNRHAGTIIWPRMLEAVENRTEESSKGGPDNVTFTYTLSCAVLICEGPIAGVRRIWANKKIVYDVSADNAGETRDPAIGSIRFHLGTDDQAQDPLIEATDGDGPAYRGYAYVVFENYDVTDMNGRPPQWEFEVITSGSDEIAESSTFGETRQVGEDTFEADMDSNGHLWLHTMTGHARVSPDTGELEISLGAPPTPQIQEYDAATGELLWYYDVPPITEIVGVNDTPRTVYPIRGTGVCSGNYYFIGRGASGNGPQDGPYTHGIAVNTQTHAVSNFTDQCSSNQFQNSFYWPSVPVPAIDNNKIYFASGNGLSADLGIGFMPASFYTGPVNDPETVVIHPVPDRTGEEPIWSAPQDWMQARAMGDCPIPLPGELPELDGVSIRLPGYAYKSTVIRSPDAVVVQGREPLGDSYLAVIAHAPAVVDGPDLMPPSVVAHCVLPTASTDMPPFVWDPTNGVIWAFAGPDCNNVLFCITLSGNELTATLTGFVMPVVSGEFQSDDIKSLAIDPASGMLLAIRGSGSYGHISLIDPMSGAIVGDAPIATGVAPVTGKMWTLPSQNKVVFANGFNLMHIPYGPSLDPEAVQLGQIVSDICQRAGLLEEDIDVTDLTDPVNGYIVPRQMTARAAIEPLQQAFFFDAVESDDKIKFVKRGSAAVTVIPEEDRAAHENGQSIPDALAITRAFELELPVQCDIEYPDIEADHLIGNQSDRRITKDTRHNLNMQIPVVMTAEKAKRVARTLLYEAWQNQTFRFTTSRKYAHLEPTSIVELPTDSASYRGRIVSKREQPNGVIEWEARVESVHVYTQTGEGATPTGHVPQEIFIPGVTQLELLDIPLLRDEDDNAGFYVAMGAL